MTDYIIMSVLLVAALIGGMYLKREAVREGQRSRAAREAEQVRRREILDEWIRSRVLHWLEQSRQSGVPDQIPDKVCDEVEDELFPQARKLASTTISP